MKCLCAYLGAIILVTAFANGRAEDDSVADPPNARPWKTASFEYEGFPLLLRAPESPAEHRKSDFPHIFVITHDFSISLPSGLPEPTYNDSLDHLDESIVGLFDPQLEGTIVLVETFGGARKYYFYISTIVDIKSKLESLREANPGHELSAFHREDPSWEVLRQFSEDWGM